MRQARSRTRAREPAWRQRHDAVDDHVIDSRGRLLRFLERGTVGNRARVEHNEIRVRVYLLIRENGPDSPKRNDGKTQQ